MVLKAEAFCSLYIIWLVTDFYGSSNQLDVYELQLADIF